MSAPDRDLIPLMRCSTSNFHNLGKDLEEVTFVKDEVVWVLQVTNRKTRKSRPATSSDLSRSNVEHQADGDELSGSLGLVISVNKRRRHAQIRLVNIPTIQFSYVSSVLN